jgi:P-type conjugative transfer protein TrbJ
MIRLNVLRRWNEYRCAAQAAVTQYLAAVKAFPKFVCCGLSLAIILCCFPMRAMAVLAVIDSAAIAKFVEQIKKQKEQIEKQVQQIELLVEEGKKLDQQIKLIQQTLADISDDGFTWDNAKSKIDKLETLLDQTHGLAYNAKSVNDQFGKIFPGYKADTDGYAAQYRKAVDATHATLKSVLNVVGGNAKNFVDEANRLRELQEQAKGAQGHLQILKASMRMAAEQVAQMQMMRQAIISQTNAQIAAYAAAMQKDATKEQALSETVHKGEIKTKPIGHSGKEITLPKKS